MSASSEQLIEEIGRLDEQISIAQKVGGDATVLIDQRVQLMSELTRVLNVLNEGKVLKG